MLHQFSGGRSYFALLPVAFDPVERGAFGVWAAWLLANIALFSPIQFHNWLWPMQFAYFFPYTFLALCICALFLPIRPGWKFGLAALCALAGNYSFVHGNLIWLVALPVILFAPGILETATRRKFAVGWIALSLLASGPYFWGLDHNSAAPAYASGHEGVPPTFTTFEQLRTHPWSTLIQMGVFVAGMFGNAVGRGFPVLDKSHAGSSRGGYGPVACRWRLVLACRRDVLRSANSGSG